LGSKIGAINRRGYCRVGSRIRSILARVSAPSTHVGRVSVGVLVPFSAVIGGVKGKGGVGHQGLYS
jgi:hypothetical protein